MKIRIRLGVADRERYDAPEEMVLDPFSVSMVEATVLQAGRDVEGLTVAFESPNHWRSALADAKTNGGAIIALVWLALRRAGVKVPFGDLDFSFENLGYGIVEDKTETPDDEVGKDTSDPVTTS